MSDLFFFFALSGSAAAYIFQTQGRLHVSANSQVPAGV